MAPPMTRRSRHPLKTLLLLALFGGATWLAWTYRDKLPSFGRSSQTPDAATLERLGEEVAKLLDSEACARAFTGTVGWRPGESRYRVQIEVDAACGAAVAKDLCAKVAHLLQAKGEHAASVFAYDAGQQIAQYVL